VPAVDDLRAALAASPGAKEKAPKTAKPAGAVSEPPPVEHDSCRVGSLLVSERVDVSAIWEAARLSHNGGNNRGGGIGFAGFAPEPVRSRTCLFFNTIGPDRAETQQQMLAHLDGLRFYDAQGRELSQDEVRLRLREFRVPVRAEFAVENGWRKAGLRENVGDLTFLFTELRGDALWRYGRRLLESPHWMQRRTKYGDLADGDLHAALERAVRRDEPFVAPDESPRAMAFRTGCAGCPVGPMTTSASRSCWPSWWLGCRPFFAGSVGRLRRCRSGTWSSMPTPVSSCGPIRPSN